VRRQLQNDHTLFAFVVFRVCRSANGPRIRSSFRLPLCSLFIISFSLDSVCAALMTLCIVSSLSVWHDLMTLYYFLPSRHCSCRLTSLAPSPFPPTSLFHYPNTAMSANSFADILDINTSREPRVTSFALVVVRLQSRTIPMFLARARTLLIMSASCQHYETI
jgi:hypothetical protein